MLMRRLGQLVINHRKAILISTLLVLVFAGVYGIKVEEHLSSGGFVTVGSESERARSVLDEVFDTGTANLLLLVTAKEGTVDSTPVRQRGLAITKELAAERGIAEVYSYWSLANAIPLRGKHGTQAIVAARIPGDEDRITHVTRGLAPEYTRSDDLIRVAVGGPGAIFSSAIDQADEDLTKAEAISVPITLVLLLLIFGSAVAASLPLLIGILAIVCTFAVLRLLALFTDVSIFALNLTTGMGLGLAVDYSLFILSRYREELERSDDPNTALLRTMHTAGRTVAFSAMSVAVAVATLLVFPLTFLRSFAYAGLGVIAVAGFASVVVLPAVLATLGERVNKWTIRRKRKEATDRGFWFHQAHRVMRHPFLVTGVIIVVLVLLGLPFLRLKLGLADDRSLGRNAPVRQVHDDLRANFSSSEAGAIAVVGTNVAGGPERQTLVEDYAKRLSTIDGVSRVDARTGFYGHGRLVASPNSVSSRFSVPSGVWFSVVPDSTAQPLTLEGEALVKRIRAAEAPFPVMVGGITAELVDTKASIFSRLPLALVLINVATFVLMFLMVGSLLVPLKSIVLNLFSLTATFGALVWIFQEGHLAGFFGITATGTIAVYVPIALFCIAFGLSQDYEVFLLSRVKEHYDLTRDNEEAVATGLQLSGRIITALAILLIVVFAAFATAQVAMVKLFGVGLALAIVVDAFIIRVTLAPALMRIAGHLNWWAPRRLRRLHLRYGIWEAEPIDALDIPKAPVEDGARAGRGAKR